MKNERYACRESLLSFIILLRKGNQLVTPFDLFPVPWYRINSSVREGIASQNTIGCQEPPDQGPVP